MRWARSVGRNLLVLVALALVAEGAARFYLALTRGSATVGLAQRTVQLSYQPFTMFGRDLDRELAPYRSAADAPDPSRYRVLLLGGSTAQGFPLPILQAAFEERLPQRRVEVINLAHGGYNARQEVVVLALWGTQLSPSLVLTLDGTNDFDHRLRVDRAGTFYLDPGYRLLLTRPFVAPVAEVLKSSQLIQGVLRLRAHQTLGSPEEYADAVPVYLEAQHSLNVLARGLGAARIMVLQPFHAYKKPLTEREAAFTFYKYREGVMMALLDRSHEGLRALAVRDGVQYLDARPLYDGMRETIFRDDVHFEGTRGYEVLARRIVASLPAAP